MNTVTPLTLEARPWPANDGYTWRVSVPALSMDLVVRRDETKGEIDVGVYLMFVCCGTTLMEWQDCPRLGDHPVEQDGLSLYPGEFDDEDFVLETALALWVQRCVPALDPLAAVVRATDLELLLKSTDWTCP